MAESTVGWFNVREKYCSLADKPWLISQIQASKQPLVDPERSSHVERKVHPGFSRFRHCKTKCESNSRKGLTIVN